MKQTESVSNKLVVPEQEERPDHQEVVQEEVKQESVSMKNKMSGFFSSIAKKGSALYQGANKLIDKAGGKLEDTGVP